MAVRQPTLSKLPGTSPLGSYIYVVHFNVGVIKVGFTRKPTDRIIRYRSTLSPFGITIADLWFSEPHEQAEDNESSLLGFCRSQAEQVRKREYFTGIDFRQVVAFAAKLPCTPLSPAPSEPAPYDASLMKYVQVADDIQARIRAGQLQPGARLPGERELADQYRIAYGTVRRVIQELRDRGLAQTVPSKGTFIVEPPTEG
ncbi:GntR family transcriptional regulator [Streptomyces mirabilis]|uniref:GntR family transcriptional regulator n=1 Tax=Streptomyces mirabilis TaxID=68239 RepID=UPI00340943CA